MKELETSSLEYDTLVRVSVLFHLDLYKPKFSFHNLEQQN